MKRVLLGQDSGRAKFCSAKGHFARPECSDMILLGQNYVRPRALWCNRVFGHNSARAEFCYGRILFGQGHSARAECSERILLQAEFYSAKPPTSQPVQPSSSQPSQPLTSQPSPSSPAKNALGDVKDQVEDKANPKPWYTADEKSNKMSTEDLLELIREYPLPEGWYARVPGLQESANYGTKFETGIYEEHVKSGYRLPLHPFALCFFEHYHMAPRQLVPNGWRKLVGLKYLMYASGSTMLSHFEMARQVVAEEAQTGEDEDSQRGEEGGRGSRPRHPRLPRWKCRERMLKKRMDDGLEIYEMGFMKANEMFAERFLDIPLGDFVMPVVASPSGETAMPSEVGDAATSHPPEEGPSGVAPEP
ncbi:hypothetical protein RJ639_039860 [Escallonia herrerae]|uniref:Transposase (putative) gypsy type domain-containing protein n=1 Tax=Escallonia herrerae TaxID=1293975 RepID=A0AA88WN44_9ASTE|nr:hypothetical protein RJ639_039860 [Escallonia herrerae]